MLCPICKSELKVTGQARLETLDEHVTCGEVSLKDEYECLNKSCQAYETLMWAFTGERYTKRVEDMFRKNFSFIDNNDGPFGSFQRQTNVEIYKKDENYDLLKTKKWRIHVVFCYKSNKDGDILKRWRKLEFWCRSGNGTETLYISGLRMFRHMVGEFHHARKRHRENENDYWKKRILDLCKLEHWHKKDWWRRWSNAYIRFMTDHFTDIELPRPKLLKRLCQGCWKNAEHSYYLEERFERDWDGGHFACPNCKTSVGVFEDPPSECPYDLEHKMGTGRC